MKKFFAIFIAVILIFSFAACSNQTDGETTSANEESKLTISEPGTDTIDKVISSENKLPTVLNTMEYTLYYNIFYNDEGSRYVGEKVEKRGTFATIHDEFNDCTRYYVWGYNDQTKCCDWQWELVPADEKNLPSDGSLVVVNGTFEKGEKALDGYWITDAEIKTEKAYKGPQCDVDLTCMSATLERVQVSNIQNFSDKYQDKNIVIYGRVFGTSGVQHPYYDDMWTWDFSSDNDVPAIGTPVVVSGILQGKVLTDAVVTETSDY